MLKRDLLHEIENKNRPKWKRNAEAGLGFIIGGILHGILCKTIKGFNTPSIPNDGYATFYAYDNNENWNTLDLEKNVVKL